MSAPQSGSGAPGARSSPELMYADARLYYLEDKNQAEVAAHLVNLAWNGLSGMEAKPALQRTHARPQH